MHKFVKIASIVAVLVGTARAALPTITIGNLTIDRGDPGALITPVASGSLPVTGFALRAQLVANTGDIVPTFASTDFTNTFWDSQPHTDGGGPVSDAPDFAEASVFLNAPAATLPSNGKLMNLRINTIDIPAGTYRLKLADTDIGVDSAFILPGGDEVTPTVIGGNITIVGNRSFWASDTDGNWDTDTNWTEGSPTGDGAGARFTRTPSAPLTVNLASPITIGSVLFDSPVKYTLSGSPITFTSSTDHPFIQVSSGQHRIASNIVLTNPTDITIADQATLELAGAVTGSPLASLTLGINSTLDLGSATINISHPSGDTAIPAQIRSWLVSASQQGQWTGPGIISSIAASNLNSSLAVGYRDTDMQTTIRLTIYGDANLDGKIDASDLSLIAGPSGAVNVGWSGGDFNYDGVRSADDYSLLFLGLARYPNGMTLPVPEPAIALIILTVISIRRRKTDGFAVRDTRNCPA